MSRIPAIALLLLLASAPALADLVGRVVSVADGDTITVLVVRTEVRVRLAGIDAPEHGQPYGNASRRSLAELCAGREVTVRERGRDGYGRVLGTVYAGGVDVNAEQVRRGFAWVYRRYSRDPQLLKLEDEARAAKRGLWQDAAPVPPWEWRERHATHSRWTPHASSSGPSGARQLAAGGPAQAAQRSRAEASTCARPSRSLVDRSGSVDDGEAFACRSLSRSFAIGAAT